MSIARHIKVVSLLFVSIYFNGALTMENRNHLIKIAQDYLNFVHDVGSVQSVQTNDLRIETLFAENLTKIDNRSILFANNRQALLPQMRGFEKEYNPQSNTADWVVNRDNALIISSSETNSVVINFEWTHVNVGRGTTTVILQCNAHNKIERIIDVWAKINEKAATENFLKSN
jgi:hypothetical protein